MTIFYEKKTGCNSMLVANIGFVIPNMDIIPCSSLINIYNYMCKFSNKFNPIILSESNNFNNKYSDLYKIIKIEETFDFDSLKFGCYPNVMIIR